VTESSLTAGSKIEARSRRNSARTGAAFRRARPSFTELSLPATRLSRRTIARPGRWRGGGLPFKRHCAQDNPFRPSRGRWLTHHRLKRPHRTEEHDVNAKPAIGEYWRREGHAFGDQGTVAKASE
jgi:hypothetical protein